MLCAVRGPWCGPGAGVQGWLVVVVVVVGVRGFALGLVGFFGRFWSRGGRFLGKGVVRGSRALQTEGLVLLTYVS